MAWFFITSKRNACLAKKYLEERKLYDKGRKITEYSEEEIMVPIREDQVDELLAEKGNREAMNVNCVEGRIKYIDMPCVRQHKMSPQEKLKFDLCNFLLEKGMTLEGVLLEDVPVNWERHGDLILLPEKSFSSDQWKMFGDDLWRLVAKSLGSFRLAKRSTVSNDNFRTPNVKLLLGDSGWVKHVDNGITYTFDISKCMFSSGNITEKIRVGNFNCEGQTVVDLYAGIGYFVLPYIIHAKAALVHACEWNQHAVEALRWNLELNGVTDKCVIHEGDNQNFPLQGVADHVSLGLIPSSEGGWLVACAALRRDQGGWLHIHGNVSSGLVCCGSGKVGTSCVVENETSLEDSRTRSAFPSHGGQVANNEQSKTRFVQKKKSLDLHVGNKETNVSSVLTQAANKNNDKPSEYFLDVKKRGSDSGNDFFLATEYIPLENPDGRGLSHFVNNQFPTCNRKLQREWLDWAEYVACSLVSLLKKSHGSKDWEVKVRHIERVKSYAPHIDHLVLDVECRPQDF